jgi:hypothetical protein
MSHVDFVENVSSYRCSMIRSFLIYNLAILYLYDILPHLASTTAKPKEPKK